jgi:hypothetical protein
MNLGLAFLRPTLDGACGPAGTAGYYVHIQELGAMNHGAELVHISAMSTSLANGARISAPRSVAPSRVISAPQSMALSKGSKNEIKLTKCLNMNIF